MSLSILAALLLSKPSISTVPTYAAPVINTHGWRPIVLGGGVKLTPPLLPEEWRCDFGFEFSYTHTFRMTLTAAQAAAAVVQVDYDADYAEIEGLPLSEFFTGVSLDSAGHPVEPCDFDDDLGVYAQARIRIIPPRS